MECWGKRMKPRLFIGSSAESLEIARAMGEALEHDAEVTIWPDGVFELSSSALEDLLQLLEHVDFGLFIFAPDDETVMRGAALNTVRDNVVFELGLFVGRLGRKRAFIVTPRGVQLHLPTDLLALAPANFDPARTDNLVASLGSAANKVRRGMKKEGPLPRPSAGEQQTEKPSDERRIPDEAFDPQPDWPISVFERVYRIASRLKRAEVIKKLDAAFRARFGAYEDTIAGWDAWLLHVEALYGGSRNVAQIRKIVREHPSSIRAKTVLGDALGRYDKAAAAKAYRDAVSASTDAASAAEGIRLVLEAEREIGEPIETETLLSALRGYWSADALESMEVMDAMQDLALVRELPQLSLSIVERAVSRAPDDTGLRFDLGYRYGEMDRHDISLWHYEAVPETERTGATWNNLGVAFGNLDMAGLAVPALEKSSDMGETLADANLADRLLAAGFFDLATQRASTAMKRENYHPNVVASLSALQTAEEGETGAKRASNARARGEHGMRAAIGEAAMAAPATMSGSWLVGDCPVSLTDDGQTVAGRGLTTEPVNALAAALGGVPAGTRDVQVTVSLRRLGNAFEGTITRRALGQDLGILGSYGNERAVVAWLPAPDEPIEVWDTGGGELQTTRWTKLT
jgi:hypothetical protein